MNVGQGFFFYGIGDIEWFQGLIKKTLKFKRKLNEGFPKVPLYVTLFKRQKFSIYTIISFLQEKEFKGMC